MLSEKKIKIHRHNYNLAIYMNTGIRLYRMRLNAFLATLGPRLFLANPRKEVGFLHSLWSESEVRVNSFKGPSSQYQ